MYIVLMTDEYKSWLHGLRGRVRDAVLDGMKGLEEGNFNNTRNVGLDVYEKKINTGAGYRLYYYVRIGEELIMLMGGSKHRQQADIKKALKIRKELDD